MRATLIASSYDGQGTADLLTALQGAAETGIPCRLALQFRRSGMTRVLRVSGYQARLILDGRCGFADPLYDSAVDPGWGF